MVGGRQDGWRTAGWLEDGRIVGGRQDGRRTAGGLEDGRREENHQRLQQGQSMGCKFTGRIQ
jgi:hypothetical protein